MNLKEEVLHLFETKIKPNGNPHGVWSSLQRWALSRVLDTWAVRQHPVPAIEIPHYHGSSTLLCALAVALVLVDKNASVMYYSSGNSHFRSRDKDRAMQILLALEIPLDICTTEQIKLKDVDATIYFRPLTIRNAPLTNYVLVDGYHHAESQFFIRQLIPHLQAGCWMAIVGDEKAGHSWNGIFNLYFTANEPFVRVSNGFSLIQKGNATRAALCLMWCLQKNGHYKDITRLLGQYVFASWPDEVWCMEHVRLCKMRKIIVEDDDN